MPATARRAARPPRRRRLLLRAAALAAGVAADRVLGDPARHHPVAWFGSAAAAAERVCWADSRARGAAHAAALVAGPALAAAALARRAPTATLAAATWAALGGTTLLRTGGRMAAALDGADPAEPDSLDAARALVPWLCSRDPAALDAAGIARATVESLAENTSDAVTGTLFWGALAGAPGVVAHRCLNTLDAMIGYRDDRYRRFGWAAARADDLANLVPARLTAAATVAAGPDRRGALRAWARDAAAHPSPNAGVVEAAAAGALGLRLGGPTRYRHGVERRPTLGDGAAPGPADVRRMVRLGARVQAIAAAMVLAGLLAAAAARPGDRV